MDNNEGEKVSWNMAEALMKQIARHLNLANDYLVYGNYRYLVLSFNHLTAVRRRIVPSLNPNERKRLEVMQEVISRITRRYKIAELNNNKEKVNQHLTKLRFKLEELNDYLMDLLDKYGYLIQKQRDTKRLI